jgi:pimeloyl-ACP methyl ester carboxylesterase
VILSAAALGQKSTATTPADRVPVILIHGIGGADLRQGGKGLISDGGWPNDVLILTAGDPQKLQFDSKGKPRTDTVSSTVVASGFWDVPFSKDITDLSKHFRKEGYVRDETLFEFAYDFRYSVLRNANGLAALVEDIKARTKKSRVDIVGHSMGGLVAKAYLSDPIAAANVRTLIFVATPHLGAPKALKALRYGDNLEAPIIDQCKLKRAVHNMPGMMNLLPGKRYFDERGGYFHDDDDLDGDGVRGLLAYDAMLTNLKNGRETRCLLRPEIDFSDDDEHAAKDRLIAMLVAEHAIAFHEALDNWRKPAGTTVINLIGTKRATIESIREKGGEVSFSYTDDGDGTVPLWSAAAVEADHIYHVDTKKLNCEHSTMIGIKDMRTQILALLTKGPGVYSDHVILQKR